MTAKTKAAEMRWQIKRYKETDLYDVTGGDGVVTRNLYLQQADEIVLAHHASLHRTEIALRDAEERYSELARVFQVCDRQRHDAEAHSRELREALDKLLDALKAREQARQQVKSFDDGQAQRKVVVHQLPPYPTEREIAILRLRRQGMKRRVIGQKLRCASDTVRLAEKRALKKLDARQRWRDLVASVGTMLVHTNDAAAKETIGDDTVLVRDFLGDKEMPTRIANILNNMDCGLEQPEYANLTLGKLRSMIRDCSLIRRVHGVGRLTFKQIAHLVGLNGAEILHHRALG